MKAKLSPTWKKHHDQRKFLKKTGIVLSTEAEERQFQEKLMCGKISVSQNAVYFYEKMTNTETRKTVPVASIEDLPGFVSSRAVHPHRTLDIDQLHMQNVPYKWQ